MNKEISTRIKKAGQDNRKEFHFFVCCDQQFDAEGVISHLKEIHKADPNAKITRKKALHLDGRDWFEWQFEWDFGNEIKILEARRFKRDNDDPMRY